MFLALIIDDSVVNWLGGIIGIAMPVVLMMIRTVYTQAKAFFAPKITKAFERHTTAIDAGAALAKEMQVQVPRVTESLDRLCETQTQQCESLKALHEASGRHELLHADTGSKLDLILGKLGVSEPVKIQEGAKPL